MDKETSNLTMALTRDRECKFVEMRGMRLGTNEVGAPCPVLNLEIIYGRPIKEGEVVSVKDLLRPYDHKYDRLKTKILES